LKKAVLIVAALLMVVSGVAAVSAYEAHAVDIKAHVENALATPYYEIDFGTMFPQESAERTIEIGLSESFRKQDRLSSVRYVVAWENKTIEGHPGVEDPDCDGFFEPIRQFITLEDADSEPGDGVYPADTIPNWLNNGCPPNWVDGVDLAGWGVMNTNPCTPDEWDDDTCDSWHIIFDVPVFDGYHNPLTDPRFISGILYYTDDDICNDDYYLVSENICNTYDVLVPHADLGDNLKFQVWEFIPHSGICD
jgi:hypothetical protein